MAYEFDLETPSRPPETVFAVIGNMDLTTKSKGQAKNGRLKRKRFRTRIAAELCIFHSREMFAQGAAKLESLHLDFDIEGVPMPTDEDEIETLIGWEALRELRNTHPAAIAVDDDSGKPLDEPKFVTREEPEKKTKRKRSAAEDEAQEPKPEPEDVV